jgi:hypothetical protein
MREPLGEALNSISFLTFLREYSNMATVRGQSAVEYMMTYGWGILVVLIAGVLLWQMGYLELGKNVTPDKRGFSQVTPQDWSLLDNGTLIVVVQNNAGTIVNLESDDTAADMLIGGSGTCTLISSSIAFGDKFRPGATSQITFDDCPIDEGIRIGDYYRVNVTIRYDNPSSGLVHKSTGILWGPLG